MRTQSEAGSKLSSFLGRRRKVLMAGTTGLAILGLTVGGFVLPDGTPAFAQNQSQEAPITTATAPASFSSVVQQVTPAVVSVRVDQAADPRQLSRDEGGPRGQGGMENFGNMPDLPPGHPLNEFLERFGRGMPDGGGQPFGQPRRFGAAQGSGFFISADGYLVTNNHVVEGGGEIEIVLDDGSTLAATVVGTDEKTDLALLKVEADREFPFVEFSEGDPMVGDWTVAIGNPFGLGGTVTAGIISARGRDIGAGPYDDFLQIDAAVNRGNSGGPAFNLAGEVIGVNTAIYSPSGGSVGIGFAIPAEVARSVVAELREHGQVTRGWLGVSIQPVNEDMASALDLENTDGAIVAEVQDGSPAAEAGFRSGDVILSVDGTEIADARALSRRIALLAPGDEAEIGIVRNGDPETVSVAIGRMDDEPETAAAGEPSAGGSLDGLGLTVAPAGAVAGAGDEGVVVTEVAPDGEAAENGIRSGDVIVEVGGEKVSSPEDVTAALSAAGETGRQAVMMLVRSGDQTRFLAMTLPSAG